MLIPYYVCILFSYGVVRMYNFYFPFFILQFYLILLDLVLLAVCSAIFFFASPRVRRLFSLEGTGFSSSLAGVLLLSSLFIAIILVIT